MINSLGEVSGLMHRELTGYVGPNDRRRLYLNVGLVTPMDEVLVSIKARPEVISLFLDVQPDYSLPITQVFIWEIGDAFDSINFFIFEVCFRKKFVRGI